MLACAASVAWAGCARTAPVRAPMVVADTTAASAPRPAVGAVLPADSEDLPVHRGDRMTGSYICAQGETSLTFVFDDVRGGGVPDEGVLLDVTFDFRFEGSSRSNGPGSAEGSAHMKGTFDPKTRRLRLHAEGWIEQPPGYTLVDFAGTVNRTGLYSGRVEGPGCTTFTASPERTDDVP